jgi:hypothetical protein
MTDTLQDQQCTLGGCIEHVPSCSAYPELGQLCKSWMSGVQTLCDLTAVPANSQTENSQIFLAHV